MTAYFLQQYNPSCVVDPNRVHGGRNGVVPRSKHLAIVGQLCLAIATGVLPARVGASGDKAKTFEIVDHYTSRLTSLFDAQRGIGGSGQAKFDVRPGLGLLIRNRSDRPLWFDVRCLKCTNPYPDTEPEKAGRLEPRVDTKFTFVQDTLLADVDYPFSIFVLADSASTDTLEHVVATVRFSSRQVRDLEKDIARDRFTIEKITEDPSGLPRSYEDIVLKDKFGLTAKPVGGRFHGGTLTVKPEGLEYVTKSELRTYAASQLRGVGLHTRTEVAFVQVDIDDAGVAKKLRLELAAMSQHDIDHLKRLVKSVQAVMDRRDSSSVRKAD